MTEMVACNLCSGTEYRVCSNRTKYLNLPEPLQIVQCTDCGLVYMNPRFTPEEYGESFIDSTFYQAYPGRVEKLVPLYPATYRVLENALGRRGTLLEIGCAAGHFLQVGQERGWQVTGLEISASLAQYARTRFNLDVRTGGSVEGAGFRAKEFDVIYISHVLEHLHDPRHCLTSIRPLIKGDGLLVIQVPNEFEDLSYVLFRRAMRNRFRRDELPTDHLYFFTPQTIARLVEETGFRVIKMSTWAWRNRRNLLNSRFRGGYLAKTVLFALGGYMRRGPNIEVLARKV
jgi:2-polyprenyl-3-methyl-5-hydroxy-6-metoxy-1,4-benzoquinol methylase